MSKQKFNLKDLLNEESANKSEYRVVMLNVYDLEASDDNFYNTEDVEELKQSIELNGGVKQNLIVTNTNSGKYRIISGHRRHKALMELAEEGKKEYEKIPCIVEKDLDKDKEQLLLIMSNSTTRVLTDYEKTKQAELLKDILVSIKKKENIPGRTREIIAEILNTSPTNIARMESISKKLTPELKEEFKNEKIGITAAYELSKKPEDIQKEIHDKYKETGKIETKGIITKELKKQDSDNTEKKEKEEIQQREEIDETGEKENDNIEEYTSYYHIERGTEKYFIGDDVFIKTLDGSGKRGVINHITVKGIYLDTKAGNNFIHFNFQNIKHITKYDN